MSTPSPPRPPASARGRPRAALRRAEAWLWTGPIGHLVGGAIDFAAALARGAGGETAAPVAVRPPRRRR